MSEKPEWFELTSGDEKPGYKPKKRLLKVAIFAAPLVLVGGAMFFAQADEEEGSGPTLNSTQNLTGTTNSVVAPLKNQTTQNSAVGSNVAPVTSTVPKTPTAPNAGVPAPGGLANDPDHGAGLDRPQRIGDDAGEHEGFEGHHDGGEHGSAPKIPAPAVTPKS